MPASAVTAVTAVLEQRLIRGTRVVIAESFGQATLRGKTMVVTSKGLVICNGFGRCAGNWCLGHAVFVGAGTDTKKNKKMGWRSGASKVCLTHLKDEDGNLLVPPALATWNGTFPRLSDAVHMTDSLNPNAPPPPITSTEVTWDNLVHAHRSGNMDQLAVLARALMARVEELKTRVIHLQDEMLERLIREE